MNETIKSWLKHPTLYRVFNETNISMITENVRVINGFKYYQNVSNVDFILKTDRMKIPNWGKKSEEILASDVTKFLLEKLLKYQANIPDESISDVRSSDLDSFASIAKYTHAQLEAACQQHYEKWWKLIQNRQRGNLPMMRICTKIEERWPAKYSGHLLSHYCKPSADALLNMRGYGKVKLRLIILCLAWAALVDEDLDSINPIHPKEALALAGLNVQELDIVNLKYFNEDRNLTLREVGEIRNLTRERIRQILANVVQKFEKVGLNQAVELWLELNAEDFWGKLSPNGGDTVKGFGINEKRLRHLHAKYAFALEVTRKTPYDVLLHVGEYIGGEWFKRSTHNSSTTSEGLIQ